MQHSFIGMLQSLLIQLFKQDPAVRQGLRAAYLEKRSSFGSSSWEWTLPDLRSLFRDMIMHSAQLRQVVILVDALDEAGEDTAEEIATFFHAINDDIIESSGLAKICISCRHYPIPSHVQTVEVWVQKHNHSDIALYVKDCLHNGKIIIDGSQQDIDRIVDALVERADGVFQWVRLITTRVIKWLREGDTTEQILGSLSEVPKDLENVYENILMNQIDRRHYGATLRLFQWVLLARRPLSLLELRHALETDQVEVQHPPTKQSGRSDEIIRRRIVVWSGSLLEIQAKKISESESESHPSTSDFAKGETVQVIHQSVNDFMITRGLAFLLACGVDNFGIESSQHKKAVKAVKISHGVLYRSCLNYLALKISCSEKSELKDVQNRYPFLSYAARFALFHAEQSDIYRGLDLEEESQLLQQGLRIWNYIYTTGGSRMAGSALYYDGEFVSDLETIFVPPKCTVLYLASVANLTDLVKYRIDCGDDINKRTMSSWAAIHAAASRGHLKVIKLLHSFGADINDEADDGETPLEIATGGGHKETVRYLLYHNESVNEGRNSALRIAVADGNIAMSRLCLGAGADVNAADKRFGTLLHRAAYYQLNEDVFQLLLEAGADVNAMGGEYGTVLQTVAVVHGGMKDIVRLLLKAGADVNAVGGFYGTALQAAAVSRGDEGIVKLLLEAGAEVNAMGGSHGTALQAATWSGNEGIVKLLLEAGVNVDAIGGWYGTALQAAAHWGNENIVKLLLDAGFKVNAVGGEYGTALRAAMAAGNEGIVKLLLEAGANAALGAADVRSAKVNLGVMATEPSTSASQVGTEALVDHNTAQHLGPGLEENDQRDSSSGVNTLAGSWLLQLLDRFFP